MALADVSHCRGLFEAQWRSSLKAAGLFLYCMTSQKSRKFPGGSLLKPKPILRIVISEHAIARLEIFKNLMPFSIAKGVKERAGRILA
jgi:hypothetical protein